MKTQKITVIGGGISGLTFAHYCTLKGYEIQVFEKEEGGGCINSQRYKDQYIDFGAHTLTNRYATVLEILEHYKAIDQIIKPLPLKFEACEGNRIYSLLRKINWVEILRFIPTAFFVKKSRQSVRDYYSKVFGKKNYKEFFHYLFQAILCQDPDNYPVEQLFKKRKRNKAYPKAFSLKEGVVQLLDLIKSNSAICVEYRNVSKVTSNEGLYELWSGEEKVAVSEFICLACDPQSNALMIKEIKPRLADLFMGIPVVRVDSLLVGCSNPKIFRRRHKSLIGFDQPFYSAILFERGGEKSWLFHFKADTSSEREKMQLITTLFSAQEGEIFSIASRSSFLPAVSIGSLEIQQKIDLENKDSGLFIVGNYMQGVAVEDCCSRAKLVVEELLLLEEE